MKTGISLALTIALVAGHSALAGPLDGTWNGYQRLCNGSLMYPVPSPADPDLTVQSLQLQIAGTQATLVEIVDVNDSPRARCEFKKEMTMSDAGGGTALEVTHIGCSAISGKPDNCYLFCPQKPGRDQPKSLVMRGYDNTLKVMNGVNEDSGTKNCRVGSIQEFDFKLTQ